MIFHSVYRIDRYQLEKMSDPIDYRKHAHFQSACELGNKICEVFPFQLINEVEVKNLPVGDPRELYNYEQLFEEYKNDLFVCRESDFRQFINMLKTAAGDPLYIHTVIDNFLESERKLEKELNKK